MQQRKKNQKKTVKVNQKPSDDKDLKTHLFWRANELLILGLRLEECILANQKPEQFPDQIETMERINRQGIPDKLKIQTEAWEDCRNLNINNLEECYKFIIIMLKLKINNENSLLGLSFACLALHVFFTLQCQSLQNNKLYKFDVIESLLANKSSEALGYWTAKLERKISAKNIQGAMSKELGEMSMKRTEEILEKYGGIDGYSSLKKYGQKKVVREEIGDKLKLKDHRQVYNILKKLRQNRQTLKS